MTDPSAAGGGTAPLGPHSHVLTAVLAVGKAFDDHKKTPTPFDPNESQPLNFFRRAGHYLFMIFLAVASLLTDFLCQFIVGSFYSDEPYLSDVGLRPFPSQLCVSLTIVSAAFTVAARLSSSESPEVDNVKKWMTALICLLSICSLLRSETEIKPKTHRSVASLALACVAVPFVIKDGSPEITSISYGTSDVIAGNACLATLGVEQSVAPSLLALIGSAASVAQLVLAPGSTTRGAINATGPAVGTLPGYVSTPTDEPSPVRVSTSAVEALRTPVSHLAVNDSPAFTRAPAAGTPHSILPTPTLDSSGAFGSARTVGPSHTFVPTPTLDSAGALTPVSTLKASDVPSPEVYECVIAPAIEFCRSFASGLTPDTSSCDVAAASEADLSLACTLARYVEFCRPYVSSPYVSSPPRAASCALVLDSVLDSLRARGSAATGDASRNSDIDPEESVNLDAVSNVAKLPIDRLEEIPRHSANGSARVSARSKGDDKENDDVKDDKKGDKKDNKKDDKEDDKKDDANDAFLLVGLSISHGLYFVGGMVGADACSTKDFDRKAAMLPYSIITVLYLAVIGFLSAQLHGNANFFSGLVAFLNRCFPTVAGVVFAVAAAFRVLLDNHPKGTKEHGVDTWELLPIEKYPYGGGGDRSNDEKKSSSRDMSSMI